MARDSSQAYDLRVSRAPLDDDRIGKFARILSTGMAEGICSMKGPWVGPDDLITLISLSAWMKQAGAEIPDAIDTMLRLRVAFVKAIGFDESAAPVPLLPSDETVVVLNLARYLADLLNRVADAADLAATEIAVLALEIFEA